MYLPGPSRTRRSLSSRSSAAKRRLQDTGSSSPSTAEDDLEDSTSSSPSTPADNENEKSKDNSKKDAKNSENAANTTSIMMIKVRDDDATAQDTQVQGSSFDDEED